MSSPTKGHDHGHTDILHNIREARMSKYQILAVAVALALIVLDGFDIAVMAFVAPGMSQEWGIKPEQLGWVLSASLFGMAAGAIFLTPFGDRIGRRKLTTISMACVTVGMILSAVAPGLTLMIAGRVLTGIGIGGMASLNAYVAEYASNARRGTVIGIYAAGFPIGGTIAGLAASTLIPELGWRSPLIVGAVLSLLMLIVAFILLPESLDYLLSRQPSNALTTANRILLRMGHAPLSSLPVRDEQVADEVSKRPSHLGSQLLVRSLLLWAAYGLFVASYYFATSWIPQLIFQASGDEALGLRMGLILNLGGVVGCLLFSLLALKIKSRVLFVGSLLLCAVGFLAFGMFFSDVQVAVALAATVGLFATASVAGFYAVAPMAYPAAARATGVGWMIGIGRLVSIGAPILVGYLVAFGIRPNILFMAYALPLLLAALAAFLVGRIIVKKPITGIGAISE